jgi:ABC-type polysaccharide/polyol phosphate export permease
MFRRMFAISRADARAAIDDLWLGLRSFQLWHLLAWNELLLKYRRSMIGPWWLTISLGITIGAIAVLFSAIYKLDLRQLLPYLCLGYIIWTMVTTIINDGCLAFIAFRGYIHQARRPLTLYICWIVWRNVIVFGHNLLLYVLVEIAMGTWPGAAGLLALPGFVIALASISWAAFLSGLIAARYRDIPPIVQSALGLIFFVTPILWLPEQLGRYIWLSYINPLSYAIEIIREPLLGRVPPLQDWAAAALTAAIGWGLTFLMFARFRKRVPYWL